MCLLRVEKKNQSQFQGNLFCQKKKMDGCECSSRVEGLPSVLEALDLIPTSARGRKEWI
jgi:hypothetical protein